MTKSVDLNWIPSLNKAKTAKLFDYHKSKRPLYPTRVVSDPTGEFFGLRGYMYHLKTGSMTKVEFGNEWCFVPRLGCRYSAIGIRGSSLLGFANGKYTVIKAGLPSKSTMGQHESMCSDDGTVILVSNSKRYINLYSDTGKDLLSFDSRKIRSQDNSRAQLSASGKYISIGFGDRNYLLDVAKKTTVELAGKGWRFGGGAHGVFGYLPDGKTEIFISEGNNGSGRSGRIQYVECEKPLNTYKDLNLVPEMDFGVKCGGHISRIANNPGWYMFCMQPERTKKTEYFTFKADPNDMSKIVWGSTGTNIEDNYDAEAKAVVSANGMYCLWTRAIKQDGNQHWSINITKFTGYPKLVGNDAGFGDPPPPKVEDPPPIKDSPVVEEINGNYYVNVEEAIKAGYTKVVVRTASVRTVYTLADLDNNNESVIKLSLV